MLGANVRVCVACKQLIDPAAIQQLPSPATLAPPEPEQALPRARFSWGIFLVVFGITWLTATLCVQLFGAARSQMLFVLVQLVGSTWVFFDARLKAIPGPLRWALGTLLMWIVVFPWYLSRRRTPQHPCPFIEGQAGPRVLLAILVVVFLLGVVIAVLKGPAG